MIIPVYALAYTAWLIYKGPRQINKSAPPATSEGVSQEQLTGEANT